MFELTNAQRKCFALSPIEDHWERMEAKQSPYDPYKTFLYLDSDRIVKCILVGEKLYSEYELSEYVTQDRKHLLPKTTKGKPVLLTSSTLQKRNGTGMRLHYSDGNINLYNELSQCSYFFNTYLNDQLSDLSGFAAWVEEWCNETTPSDIEDIFAFSHAERQRIRYQEGDVFRFKIGRRLYGYGRILLNYDKMRKDKVPFWDILMGKPLVCSVYHIVTENSHMTLEELKNLSSLPSAIVMDNAFYYGEYKIIGNLPITDQEDYPILYGNSISATEKDVFYYQCGKVYRRMENGHALFHTFRNNGVPFNLNLTLDILQACIKANSNMPYWENYYPHFVDRDLRNPKHAEKLRLVKKQLSILDE